ncbi:MAG TPA: cytochrome b/b6 domain-containing protein [Gammaproteobacteria bacterium]|nr:cytochrome b/b6 domain-containing protein [Gammaproteobacteria bacterium]
MQRKLVWDLPVRVFHWSLVLLLGASWGSAELGRMDLHRYSGYAVATLLLFRLAWGIAGPRYARFAGFITGPRRVFRYLRALTGGDVPLTAGHTPAGGWMILLLLALLAAQVATGMVNSHDGLDAGPWYWAASSTVREFAHAWHPRLFDLLLVFSAVHVLAVLSYRRRPGIDLVGPMITGRKLTAEPGIPASRLPLAIALLLAAAAAVWLIVRAAPAPSLADLGIY